MGKKILLVDDEAGFAELLRDLLIMDGYDVQLSHDGVEALEALNDFMPHVIISDIMMPRMGGFELFKKLRTQPSTSHIPFLFISGFQDERVLQEVRQIGEFTILPKPIDMEKIEEQLNEILK